MDENVSLMMNNILPVKNKVGRQIIDIITTGMYSNPLMVLREYIQNAVDGIDEALAAGVLKDGDGRIDIEFDLFKRKISVFDNGIGLEKSRIIEILCGLGISTKTNDNQRGFRGIGRLGGIGYSEKVVFETRSSDKEPITVITWDSHKLREEMCKKTSSNYINTLLKECVIASERRPSVNDPGHFFQVTLYDIQRFHRDELMRVDVVESYISQIAPVPFNEKVFQFSDTINNHLKKIDGYRSYIIRVNNKQIFRPHTCDIIVDSKKIDRIEGVQLFEIKDKNCNPIGCGWYAQTKLLASLPINVGMRGMRVRQGNIEVGDEYFLENIFSERRFATWHIGEIHLNFKLKTNARRDGFEQTEDYESFLEQANSLGRHLSRLCRASSKKRSTLIIVRNNLDKLNAIVNQPYFINKKHIRKSIETALSLITKLESLNGEGDLIPLFWTRLSRAKQRLSQISEKAPTLNDVLDGRCLRHVHPKVLLQSIAQTFIESKQQNTSLENIVEHIIAPYVKKRFDVINKGK